MMTDPIADMLTRIRNAIQAGHDRVEFPASKVKAGVLKVMKDEGYIRGFKIVAKEKANISIKVLLKEDAIVSVGGLSAGLMLRTSLRKRKREAVLPAL